MPYDDYARGKRDAVVQAEGDDDFSSMDALLKIRNMKLWYPEQNPSLKAILGMEKKSHVKAVDDISLKVLKGTTMASSENPAAGKAPWSRGSSAWKN